MDKLESVQNKSKEVFKEIYTPYKHLTPETIFNDDDIDNIYEKYLKSAVIIFAMIFINVMMLKIELTKHGFKFIHNKYTEYRSSPVSDEDYDAEDEEEEPYIVKKDPDTGRWNATFVKIEDNSEKKKDE